MIPTTPAFAQSWSMTEIDGLHRLTRERLFFARLLDALRASIHRTLSLGFLSHLLICFRSWMCVSQKGVNKRSGGTDRLFAVREMQGHPHRVPFAPS